MSTAADRAAALAKERTKAWAAKITAAWRKSLESIFEVGDLLIAAKAEIGHGQWSRMCEFQLPFKIGTAQRLMLIADDQRLRNTALGPYLPPSWRTLYELTKWDDELLERALAEGRIHPEMSKADAANLLTPTRPPPPMLKWLAPDWGAPPPRPEDFGPDNLQIFLEFLEAYFPTVPKIELFRRTAPRGKWQAWGVEISECPDTRTVNLKAFGEYLIIRMPARAPAVLALEPAEEELGKHLALVELAEAAA